MAIVHSFDSTQSTRSTLPMKSFLMMLGVAILAGALVGFLIGHLKGATSKTASSAAASVSDDSAPKTAGVQDKSTFKDEAEGQLKEGGIEGEGAYHLVRPGGESQYVYLTSSTVDLSKYIDKKVKVHGSTIAGQKAGWLMDVGYVELQ